MIFSDKITLVSDLKPASMVTEELSRRVLQLVAGGGTNLNAAICQAVEMMNAKSAGDVPRARRLNGIVLLSDGADTIAEVTDTRMFQTCIRCRAKPAAPRSSPSASAMAQILMP